MNNIAICPNLFMYALQNQNVERKLVKKFDIKHLAKDGLNENIDINGENNLKEKEKENIDINGENNLKTDLKQDVEEETTNISDIPAILLEPSI